MLIFLLQLALFPLQPQNVIALSFTMIICSNSITDFTLFMLRQRINVRWNFHCVDGRDVTLHNIAFFPLPFSFHGRGSYRHQWDIHLVTGVVVEGVGEQCVACGVGMLAGNSRNFHGVSVSNGCAEAGRPSGTTQREEAMRRNSLRVVARLGGRTVQQWRRCSSGGGAKVQSREGKGKS